MAWRISWPLSEELTYTVLKAKLFGDAGTKQGHHRQLEPDWTTVHRISEQSRSKLVERLLASHAKARLASR